MNKIIYFLVICFNIIIIIHNSLVKAQLASRILTVTANSTIELTIYDSNENRPQESIRFFTVGVHSQKYNLTLFKANNTNNSSITGHNIGLVLIVGEDEGLVFIRNNNSVDINALIVTNPHKSNDPIPGGCNEEFPLEISPFLRLYDNGYVNRLEYQFANIGTPKGFKPMACDKSKILINYEIYSYFMEENDYTEDEYFRVIYLMSNTSNVINSGVRLTNSSTTRSYFFLYPGRGIVYNIIASSQQYSSVYVPIVTYDCKDLNNCGKQDITVLVVSVVLGLLGSIVCMRGHRYFQTQMFIFGLIDGSFIGYILLLKYTTLSDTELSIFTIVIGLIVSVLWLFVWKILYIPVLSLLLSGFSLGLLFVSTILFTNIGNLDLFHNDLNYWLIISCSMILITLFFLLINAVVLSVVSTAVVGSYLAVTAIDRFTDGSLSYIMINVIKRSIFNYSAINSVPFQNKDIVLSILWILLALTGIVLQLHQSSDRRPFPAPNSCSHPHRERRRNRHSFLDREDSDRSTRRALRNRRFSPVPTAPAQRVDERTSLLYPNYNINNYNNTDNNSTNNVNNRLGVNRPPSPPPDYSYATNANQRDYQSI